MRREGGGGGGGGIGDEKVQYHYLRFRLRQLGGRRRVPPRDHFKLSYPTLVFPIYV